MAYLATGGNNRPAGASFSSAASTSAVQFSSGRLSGSRISRRNDPCRCRAHSTRACMVAAAVACTSGSSPAARASASSVAWRSQVPFQIQPPDAQQHRRGHREQPRHQQGDHDGDPGAELHPWPSYLDDPGGCGGMRQARESGPGRCMRWCTHGHHRRSHPHPDPRRAAGRGGRGARHHRDWRPLRRDGGQPRPSRAGCPSTGTG